MAYIKRYITFDGVDTKPRLLQTAKSQNSDCYKTATTTKLRLSKKKYFNIFNNNLMFIFI